MNKSLFIIVLCCLIGSCTQAQQPATAVKPVKSVEAGNDHLTFSIAGPSANSVKVQGSWLKDDESVDLVKDADGVWSVKVPLEKADLYTYNFVIDGVRSLDMENPFMVRDRNSYYNAVIMPGAKTKNFVEAKQRGNLTKEWYNSPTIGTTRRMYVYTPYGYGNNTETYPVLYLLHPGGRDEEAWTTMGRACQILDNLIEQKLAQPMIVVMPNINPEQEASKTTLIAEANLDANDPQVANLFPQSVVKDIIPHIEKNYRVKAEKSSRAIAGASRGGRNTMIITSDNPGTFDYICVLSMGLRGADVDEADARLQKIKASGYKLYWIGCGTEDHLFDQVNVLDEALTRNGIEHIYHVSSGAHTWSVWRNYLNKILPLLFK